MPRASEPKRPPVPRVPPPVEWLRWRVTCAHYPGCVCEFQLARRLRRALVAWMREDGAK